MAATEITISGVLYDKLSRTSRPVTLIGEAILTGLEIGGGPIVPPPGGGAPPGIWGPPGPWPTPPINLPPGSQQPPQPAHPIVLPTPPDPPIDPPVDPPTNPGNPEWHWCWNPQTGWIPAFVAPDKPQPPH